MTALDKYDRLESTGVWREDAKAQRRDVIVSLGEASLVITDKAERVLTHWSLPALIHTNPGNSPAILRPGPDAVETLELDDAEMIEAIATVRTAIERRRPRPGRLRGALVLGLALAIAVPTVVFLPDTLARYTASVVPDPARDRIGAALLSAVERVTGPECRAPRADRALARLKSRLLPYHPGRIAVLPGGTVPSLHLPGGLILVDRALVEDFENPETLAGFILAEATRAAQHDPVRKLLDALGVRRTLGLLTTGQLPPETLARYAETLVTAPAEPLPDAHLLAAFKQARVPSSAYAYAIDISGESTLSLIEADPHQTAEIAPVLSDADWVVLQGICGE